MHCLWFEWWMAFITNTYWGRGQWGLKRSMFALSLLYFKKKNVFEFEEETIFSGFIIYRFLFCQMFWRLVLQTNERRVWEFVNVKLTRKMMRALFNVERPCLKWSETVFIFINCRVRPSCHSSSKTGFIRQISEFNLVHLLCCVCQK